MKTNYLKSVCSVLLCLAMLLTMLPVTGTKVSAAIAAEDILAQVADPSTLDGYKANFGLNGELNTNNAGGVWIDKSVLTDASALPDVGITKDDPNGFLVALSTMAANMSIVGMSHVPTDSILVLDVSGSMDMDRNNVAEDLVEAANASIHTLLTANKHNRVGVVLYSGDGSSGSITILSLNRYSTASDGAYLTYTRSGSTETIGIDNDVVYENTTTKPVNASKNVVGATYIQKGVMSAVSQFVAESNSVTVTDPALGTMHRKPVLVLMSDGAPTLGTTDFTNPGNSTNLGNGESTSAAISFVTQLTLAYARSQIKNKYSTEPLFYTLGLGVGNDANARSVLDPANSSSALNNFWLQYNAADVNNTVTVRSGGWFTSSREVTKISTELTKNYVDKYFDATGSGTTLAQALKDAFKDIMDTIQIQSGYFPTLISESEELSGYVSFVDRIGHGMTVKDIKGILIGDKLFSGADLASNFVPGGGALGTTSNLTPLGEELVASVQARLGIESIEVAVALIALAYQNGQLRYNNANDFSNYIGWYANAAGKFLGFYNEGTTVLPEATGNAATDPAFTIKSYGYLGEVDAERGVSKSDMMYATVQVRRDIQTGDEIVTFAVPAALIPTLTYNVELGENGALSDLTATGAQAPIRLIYEVALKEELNVYNIKELLGADYLSDPHNVNADGSINLYTNQWDHDNVIGYGTNNTYAYFNPSRQNDRYYYLEDAPIYTDQSGTLYTGGSQPSGTLYRKYTVYAKNGDSLETRTVYRVLSSAALETAKRASDNSWYIPKGNVHVNLDGYTLYKGGLTQEDPNMNRTQTLLEAIVPFVDTKNHSINDAGYQFYVGATMGNNGKLTVMPETGLKISKKMADPTSAVTEPFTFTLRNLTSDATVTYPALMIAPDGTGNDTTVTFTEGVASVDVRPGYSLYIGGMTAGHEIYITEENSPAYVPIVEGLSQTGTVTVIVNNMTDVNFVNAVRGLGNLTITKEIEHDLGSAYEIPADKTFTMQVTLTGADVQNATFSAEHTNGTVEEISVVDGVFTVALKNDESLKVFGIPEGTGVTVVELDPAAGFTPSYRDNGVADDGKVAIEKDMTTTVVVTNTYEPDPVYPVNISVSGTKTLTGRDWTAEDKFEFQLQKLVGVNTWQKLGDSVYATSEQKVFSFDNVFDNASYTDVGINYYRIVEIQPDTPLGGVAYDKKVHSFTVTVADADMDGKLEIASVRSDRPDTTVVEGNVENGWTVTANFENAYSATGSAIVTVDVNKTVNSIGGTEKSLAGYEFGIFDANGQLVGTTLKTTERGFARFALRYFAEDAGQSFTYTLKEIHPASIPDYWNYSSEEVKLTVNVTDNGDGTISAVIYIGEESANASTSVETAFVNTYTAKKATLPVDFVKKTVNGQAPGDRVFDFALNGNGVSLTGSNDANGNVHFSDDLEFTSIGTYRFTITETSTDGDGITTDKTVYTLVVTVTDNEKGELIATYALENAVGQTLTIDNTYTASAEVYAISGKKILTGRPLLNDEFIFILKEVSVDGVPVADPATYEVKNFLDGTFTFPAYTYRAEGTYVYEVTEKQAVGETFGVTYDTSVYTVTVNVTDNGKGSLVAKATYEKDGSSADALEFRNKYTPKPTYVEFTGDKELTGKINNTLEGDEFQFELYKSNANWALGELKETVPNQAGGKFTFTKINFETDEDQYFIVREKNAGETHEGITYDTTEYRVYVEVIDDLKGQLHTVVNIFDGNGVPQDSIQFTNIYQVTGDDDVELSGVKQLNGRDWLETDAFRFNLYLADSTFAYEENDLVEAGVVNAATAEHRYTISLHYTAEDVGKIFYYVLTESKEGLPVGVSRDSTVYQITVAVTDDDKGGVKTVTTVENATVDTLNFINEYAPEPANVVIEGEKKLTGRKLQDGEFRFLAYRADVNFQVAADAEPVVVKNAANGDIRFEIPVAEAGTYCFVVKEDTTVSARLVTFDRTVYWVSVNVEDVDGQLVASDPVVTLEDGTAPVDEILFQNAYDPNIPQTGDDTNLALWMSLMVISLLAATALLIFEKRRKQA